MAAPQKTGLDYYPRDTDLLKDRKFVKAKIRHGYLSLVVYDALLEIIYRDKGYYVDYSDSEKETVVWDILECLRGKYLVEAETVYSVIEMLVECRLFSHDHFKQGVITGKRIQETYYKCTVERKNVEVDKKIWLLSVNEMQALSTKSSILSNFINQPNNEDNQPNNEDNQPNNSQSKVKESKVKESKGEGASPTLEDVKAFCKSENLVHINADKFYNHYSAKNWNGIADWKSKAKNWDIEDKAKFKDKAKHNGINYPKNVFNNYDQRYYTEEEIKEILRRKNES